MEIIYMILFFVYGTIFGSFYNVVGDRLVNRQSIVKPPSHCPKCGHKLTALELIPIVSYVIQLGRCKKCKCKIPVFHPLYEAFVGLLFMFCYISFGFTSELSIALTFVSMLAIIIVSDIYYMVILDEILIFFGILLGIEILLINGVDAFIMANLNGLICFGTMYLIKIMGDFLFKKESMGGGDIKLLFFFGLVLGWQNGLASIFLGSIIGLPISLIILSSKRTNVIPFGPFLALASMILLFTHFNLDLLTSMLFK